MNHHLTRKKNNMVAVKMNSGEEMWSSLKNSLTEVHCTQHRPLADFEQRKLASFIGLDHKNANFSSSLSTSSWLFSLATSTGVFPSRFCRVLHQKINKDNKTKHQIAIVHIFFLQENNKKHQIAIANIFCRKTYTAAPFSSRSSTHSFRP